MCDGKDLALLQAEVSARVSELGNVPNVGWLFFSQHGTQLVLCLSNILFNC